MVKPIANNIIKKLRVVCIVFAPVALKEECLDHLSGKLSNFLLFLPQKHLIQVPVQIASLFQAEQCEWLSLDYLPLAPKSDPIKNVMVS